jgi:hypothetical protein
MAAKKSTPVESSISNILTVSTGVVSCYIVGTSPLILNRMSEKAKHELLLPKGRKSAVERATSLKHVPLDEYRASAYTLKAETAPTWLAHKSTAFKKAICTAALDMPGAKKAQIGRLTFVEGEFVPIYGVPRLHMAITRSADINKTPDVRTRATVPAWACVLRVTFVKPLIQAQAVVNLLAAAGITMGVGDWRQEKGSGSYGQFRIATEDDPEFQAIVREGGRAAQLAAMESPTCYDDETTELLSWFETERGVRQLRGVAS